PPSALIQSHASWAGGWFCASRKFRHRDVLDCGRVATSVFCRANLPPAVYVSFKNTEENIPSWHLDFAVGVEFETSERSGTDVRCKAKGHRRRQCGGGSKVG